MGNKNSSIKSSHDSWPELEPVRKPATPEQELAKEMVRKSGENAAKLLITRSRELLAVVIIALLSAVITASKIIPSLLQGKANTMVFVFALAALSQLCAAAYFTRARDPAYAELVLRLMLIINGLSLLMGFSWLGSIPIALAGIIAMLLAYGRMAQLKYGRN